MMSPNQNRILADLIRERELKELRESNSGDFAMFRLGLITEEELKERMLSLKPRGCVILDPRKEFIHFQL